MMLEKKTTEFLEELSSAAPVPGGGGASATAGAYAAALGLMVGNLTIGKKKYADVEEEICEIMIKLEKLRNRMTALVDEDASAFEPLSKVYGMPKETEEQKQEKEKVEGAEKSACKPAAHNWRKSPAQNIPVFSRHSLLLKKGTANGSALVH